MPRQTDDLRLVDIEHCEMAAMAIRNAFDWSKTREGADYWGKIVERLEALAKAKRGRPISPPPRRPK